MTITLQTRLTRYFNAVVGDPPWLEPIEARGVARIPLFIRNKYVLFHADLFGKSVFLALEKESPSETSPSEYRRDIALLKKEMGNDVIAVIPSLPSYARKSMVQQRIPFIVPGTQMFLPMLLIDLREQYSKHRTEGKETLSYVAQVVVIYHLVYKQLDQMPMGSVASQLGYSPTAIGSAKDELQHFGVCDVVREGKNLFLEFKKNKREVWQTAEHLMSTPVKRTKWIRWGHPRPEIRLAGLSALSAYTMLAESPRETYAIRDRNLRAALETGQLIGCASQEDSEARLELWRYEPSLLSSKMMVDPCSLYLSLRHSADERVQKELDRMLNGFLG
jgi:hypothetical protein